MFISKEVYFKYNNPAHSALDGIVLYVDGNNPFVPATIDDYYTEIRDYYTACCLQFVFFPRLKRELDEIVFRYFGGAASFAENDRQIVERAIGRHLVPFNKTADPKLFVFGRCGVTMQNLDSHFLTDRQHILNILRELAFEHKHTGNSDICVSEETKDQWCCCSEWMLGDISDEPDGSVVCATPEDAENQELINKMREAWQQLRKRGISEEMLLCMLQEPPRPSRLLIKDNQVYLLDMDMRLVKLSPLDRAFFVLHINHPEGINLKDMVDYADELLEIYSGMAAGDNNQRQHETIYRFVDPTQNLMNIAMSRIKRAFLALLSPTLAGLYYVQGAQGERKSIELDRRLVVRI